MTPASFLYPSILRSLICPVAIRPKSSSSAASSLGSEPCVFTRRRNSPLSRSMTLVVRMFFQCCFGETIHREELVAGFFEALHHAGAARLPLAHEGRVRLASRRLALGVDDLVEICLQLGQRVLGCLALEIAQLVDRAPLHRCLAPHGRERPPEPSVAVDDAEHRRSEAALD